MLVFTVQAPAESVQKGPFRSFLCFIVLMSVSVKNITEHHQSDCICAAGGMHMCVLITNQKAQRQTKAKTVTIIKPQEHCEH